MTGIKILNQEKVSLYQGILKLKMVSLNEYLKGYRKISNKTV